MPEVVKRYNSKADNEDISGGLTSNSGHSGGAEEVDIATRMECNEKKGGDRLGKCVWFRGGQ